MRTAIIGAGLVGRAWAISFARAGHTVRLWDADPDALPAALAFIDGVLPDLAVNGLLGGAEPADVRARIAPTHDLEEALAEAGHVQENTPERFEVKARVFLDLDRLAPPAAVIASSTSALLPSAFQAEVAGRARCLVCHPINPPYLIQAVEVVPSPWTSPDVVARAAAFMRGCGQTPLVMKREIDGFIMNRIQGALMEECFRLVADGVASAEDVDIGIRDGLALRWSFMGPFETIDLNAPGRCPRLRGALPGHVRADLPVHAAPGRLVGTRHGRNRGGPRRPPRPPRPRRAPGLARPPPHGALGPQARCRRQDRRVSGWRAGLTRGCGGNSAG